VYLAINLGLMAGNQVETNSLYGIRCFGSLRTSVIWRGQFQKLCAISVRAGTAGIEPDSGDRLGSST
jgi:hypothetical protein